MANVLLHRKALELRQHGKSYSQIRNELGVSKSTLNGWLKKYPLTKEQIYQLSHNEVRIEKFRVTMLKKRKSRLNVAYNEARNTLLPLSKRELFIAGLFLYWGEGGKTERSLVTISNTDPGVLKFALYWMVAGLDIPKDKIKVFLHLYSDMDIEEAFTYWSKTLSLPTTQFVKPYIKLSTREEMDYKGFGHGTCMLKVGNTLLKEKIVMSLKVMGDYATESIPEF